MGFDIEKIGKRVEEKDSQDFEYSPMGERDPQEAPTSWINDVTDTQLQQVGMTFDTMTFSMLDDLIQKVNPEKGEEFRQFVKEARIENPATAKIVDFVAPTPVDLAGGGSKKAVKFASILGGFVKGALKGIARATSEDLAYQVGEQDVISGKDFDYSGRRGASSAAIGGTLRGLTGMVDAPSLRRRGSGSQAKEFARFADDNLSGGDDAITKFMDDLKVMGFFKTGKRKFNPYTMSFELQGKKLKDKAKDVLSSTAGKSIPIGFREMNRRIDDMLETLRIKREDILTSKSTPPSAAIQMDMFEDQLRGMQAGLKQVTKANKANQKFNQKSLERITEEAAVAGQNQARRMQIEESMADTSDTGAIDYASFLDDARAYYNKFTGAKREKMKEELKKIAQDVWGEGYDKGASASIFDLNKKRIELDARAKKLDQPGAVDKPIEQQAIDFARDSLRKRINKMAGDDFVEAGDVMSRLSEFKKGIERRIENRPQMSTSYGSANPKVAAAGIVGNLKGRGAMGMANLADIVEPIEVPYRRAAQRMGGRGMKEKHEESNRSMFQAPEVNTDIFRSPDSSSEFEYQPMGTDYTSQSPYVGKSASEMLALRTNLEEVMAFRSPRTTQGFIDNIGMFKLKFAQMADEYVKKDLRALGIDPNNVPPQDIQRTAHDKYTTLATMIEKNPEELKNAFHTYIDKYPDLFEKDPFNRRDGEVPYKDQPKVREDIYKQMKIRQLKGEGKTMTQLVNSMMGLNITGEYEE